MGSRVPGVSTTTAQAASCFACQFLRFVFCYDRHTVHRSSAYISSLAQSRMMHAYNDVVNSDECWPEQLLHTCATNMPLHTQCPCCPVARLCLCAQCLCPVPPSSGCTNTTIAHDTLRIPKYLCPLPRLANRRRTLSQPPRSPQSRLPKCAAGTGISCARVRGRVIL